jgi:hypothetical protein
MADSKGASGAGAFHVKDGDAKAFYKRFDF